MPFSPSIATIFWPIQPVLPPNTKYEVILKGGVFIDPQTFGHFDRIVSTRKKQKRKEVDTSSSPKTFRK
jgi:hypothetical protein